MSKVKKETLTHAVKKRTHSALSLSKRRAIFERMSLSFGTHKSAQDGLCVMEATAYLAGEAWSDHPVCACPVISTFLRIWNDSLPTDWDRDRLLKPLVAQLIGTRSSVAVAERRSYLALDWMIRVYTPKWFDLVPALAAHATALRALKEITGSAGVTAAGALTAAARIAAAGAAQGAAEASEWGARRNARRNARSMGHSAGRSSGGRSTGRGGRTGRSDGNMEYSKLSGDRSKGRNVGHREGSRSGRPGVNHRMATGIHARSR